ncbi:MAG: LPS export ABC transporter periplasmic protein LptC, partial [Omnitrophica WOR_2 bacterium GWA2_47_8]
TDESFGGAQQFEGFNLQGFTDRGEKAWDVNGDTADVSGNVIRISNVVANSYEDEKVNLTAKVGMINKDSGNIHLEDDVVITSQIGAILTTDSLDWERNNDLVKTPDPVKITHEKMVTTGTGMVAHPNLKTAQLNEDVTVNMEDDSEPSAPKKVVITCDGPLELDQAKNIAIFNEHVVAIQDGGRELHADMVELYFDPQTKKIQRMICIGNVVVVQGENKSYSDKAVYSGADQKITLSGRPKLIMVTQDKGGLDAFTPDNNDSSK